ncbi:MAG: NADH:ubiquinone reductase (Na(+)-transporting) subunit B [Thermoguttaceae bacterium]|nr:NADH:ubiquinone reductase (Na(+)-transporting) subunit B [Thermoguttaceae bacterium]
MINYLRRTIKAIDEKYCAEDKKFRGLHPLVEAIDTFFFTPDHKTTGTVHVRDFNDFKRVMITVILGLIPCAVFGIYNVGYQANLTGTVPGDWHGSILSFIDKILPFLHVFRSTNVLGCFVFGLCYYLPVYIVTMLVGLFWEVLFAAIYKHEVNEGFFVTGFIFPLICPATVPLWQVTLAITFGVVIGKEIFGGTGRNFLNPALVARAFLFFAYSGQITGDKVWIAADGVSKATPLAYARGGVEAIQNAGYSTFDAFFGFIPGAVGETSTFCCMLGMIFLIVVGVAPWRIVASTFAGGLGLAAILAHFSANPESAAAIGPMWHLVLGGFAFGAIFMATDPVSAAQSNLGQIIYGLLIGALIVVVRVYNPAYPEGAMLAILFGNCVAPLIDHFVVEANIRRRQKRLQAR